MRHYQQVGDNQTIERGNNKLEKRAACLKCGWDISQDCAHHPQLFQISYNCGHQLGPLENNSHTGLQCEKYEVISSDQRARDILKLDAAIWSCYQRTMQ
jgi:outer membrane lipopolysaccharide assembly protein LptE/RlpB